MKIQSDKQHQQKVKHGLCGPVLLIKASSLWGSLLQQPIHPEELPKLSVSERNREEEEEEEAH